MRAGEAIFRDFKAKVRPNEAFYDKELFLTENVEFIEIKRLEKKRSIDFSFLNNVFTLTKMNFLIFISEVWCIKIT